MLQCSQSKSDFNRGAYVAASFSVLKRSPEGLYIHQSIHLPAPHSTPKSKHRWIWTHNKSNRCFVSFQRVGRGNGSSCGLQITLDTAVRESGRCWTALLCRVLSSAFCFSVTSSRCPCSVWLWGWSSCPHRKNSFLEKSGWGHSRSSRSESCSPWMAPYRPLSFCLHASSGSPSKKNKEEVNYLNYSPLMNSHDGTVVWCYRGLLTFFGAL